MLLGLNVLEGFFVFVFVLGQNVRKARPELNLRTEAILFCSFA